MTVIHSLQLNGVRNIASASLELSPTANLLYGQNGAGKTTVLESIALLASGKSFRTHKTDTLIQQQSAEMVVAASLLGGAKLGMQKRPRQSTLLRLNEETQRNWEQAARALPVQSLDSQSFDLVLGGPGERRSFIDWGVFHVEQSFVEDWRAARKCLAQRNLLLRKGVRDAGQFEPWEQELARRAERIHLARQAYLQLLETEFQGVYAIVAAEENPIEIAYKPGWVFEDGLLASLRSSRESDARLGATQHGPHRADLVLKTGGSKAVDILSRGQLKLLVYALRIAQGLHMAKTMANSPVFLLDDLPSELDTVRRARVLSLLTSSGSQLVLSAVEKASIIDCIPPEATECRLFHVERGKIHT